MAKRLSKGKRQALLKTMSTLRDWDCPFWSVGGGWNSIAEAQFKSAQRAAVFLRRTDALKFH